MSTSKQKTVGVIGGMGPAATVDFMSKVIAATPAARDQDHIRMLVDSDPHVPNRQAALLGDGDDPSSYIAAMGVGLEKSGADFLVMPCNTAHAFIDELHRQVSIPLVSIIEVTADACSCYDAVGLMATNGCLVSGIYQDALKARGITPVEPTGDELETLMSAISAVKAGDLSAPVREAMSSVASGLADRDAKAVISGCTEIPLVLGAGDVAVPLLESTDLLAEYVAGNAGAID